MPKVTGIQLDQKRVADYWYSPHFVNLRFREDERHRRTQTNKRHTKSR